MAFQGNLTKWQVDRTCYTGAAATTVVFDWQNLRLKSIQVYNSGAAYTSAVLLVSNDKTNWGTLTNIAGGTLGSTGVWQYTDETAYKYYAFDAVVAGGTMNLSVKFA